MTTVGFECVHCHARLTVRAESAGKAIKCPSCHQVVVAPSAGTGLSGFVPTPVPRPKSEDAGRSTPDLSGFSRKPLEAADSIFGDPDDEDESLFGGHDGLRKPLLPQVPTPSAVGADQPTVRVPGVATLPPTKPAGPPTPANGFAGVPTVVTPVAVPTPEAGDPFSRMVDDVAKDEKRKEVEEREELEEEEPEPNDRPRASGRMKWALIGVSVYAVLATAAAVVGWTRSPADKPPVVVPPKK